MHCCPFGALARAAAMPCPNPTSRTAIAAAALELSPSLSISLATTFLPMKTGPRASWQGEHPAGPSPATSLPLCHLHVLAVPVPPRRT